MDYEARQRATVKKYIKWGIIAFVSLMLLITLLSSITTIGTGKVGVVTNFGRVTGRELTEGMSTKIPFAESVTEYDIKVQKEEITAPAATKDLQDVNSTLAITYQLKRGSVSFTHQEFGKDYKDKVLPQAVNETFKAVSAKYTASELITERARVKVEVQEGLTAAIKKLSKDTLVLLDVSITNFTFSAEFNKAIEAVQIANQRIAQARQEYETAKVNADKLIAEAQGQAEAQRLQQQTLTPELLQKQAIEKWDGKLPVYSTGGNTFFNIPTK